MLEGELFGVKLEVEGGVMFVGAFIVLGFTLGALTLSGLVAAEFASGLVLEPGLTMEEFVLREVLALPSPEVIGTADKEFPLEALTSSGETSAFGTPSIIGVGTVSLSDAGAGLVLEAEPLKKSKTSSLALG